MWFIFNFRSMMLNVNWNGRPIERLKIDQGYPNEIVFGDPIKPNQIPRIVSQTQIQQNLKPIFISRQLFINEQLPKVYESTQSVYTVGYLGFASYISSMREAELILFSFLVRFILHFFIFKNREILKRRLFGQVLLLNLRTT